MSLLNRQELFELLTQGEIEVNFTKVSGAPRKMRCTLQPDLLPPQKDVVDAINRTSELWGLEDSGRMIVLDLDAADWRSFKIESLTYVLIPTPEEDNG